METEEQNKLKEVHFNSYEELYEKINEEGSLGILALGARGLLLWRRKREELYKERESRNKEND